MSSISRRAVLSLGVAVVVGGCTRTGTGAPSTAAPSTTATPPPSTPPTTSPPATSSPASPPPTSASSATVGSTTTDPAGGWDEAALDELVAFARSRATDALRIEQDGVVIVDDQRAEGTPFVGEIASAQKSVVALLVGIAVEDGIVDLDATVTSIIGDGWSAAPFEADVTVRHLMSMTSGLDEALAPIGEPGAQWWYCNSAYHVVHDVLGATTAGRMQALSDDWLFGPIGASPRWYERPGTSSVAVQPDARPKLGLLASTDDLCRIGRLVAERGRVDGRTLLSATTIEELTERSQAHNPSYGLLWWRNDLDGYRVGRDNPLQPGPPIPSAPTSLAAALGAEDQKLYVWPDERIVVARLGERGGPRTLETVSSFDEELWQYIDAASAP